MNKYIKALVKVTSQYEYAQNFRDGRLWMNELRFFTKCEQKELGDARVYLKTPNAPGQRVFLRCAASFFLEIRQYSCEKMSCAT